MNTEDRLREYFANKAPTLRIPGRLMSATPPPTKRTRTATLILATAAALVLVGLPLVVLSLISVDSSGVEETLPVTTFTGEVTTTTPVTTTTIAPLIDLVAPSQTCADTAPTQPPGTVLTFYATCDSVLYPMYRPGTVAPSLQQSLAALVAGTTAEEQGLRLYAGFDSVDDADRVEVNATVDEAGTAHVKLLLDGNPWLADTGSWSSTQLLSLLDPLQATVFANEDVIGLDMSTLCFEQIACDRTVSRAEWAGILFTNTGILVHSGCTVEQARTDPDNCTLSGVLSGTTFSGNVTDVPAGDTLKVRAGPGEEFFVLDELNPDAAVVVTNAISTANDGGIWRVVDSAVSEPGWVNAAYLDIVEP